MSTRQDYITALGTLVKNESALGEAGQIAAIGQALRLHSKHRPLVIPEDESGDGGFDYPVSLLASWSDGLSMVKSVEYPVDNDVREPNILDEDAWKIYSKPDGDYLRFLQDSPSASELFRVVYTAAHVCDDTQCTVKAADEEAVQALAAAFLCDMLATYYAQTQDSTIGADSVDHKSKAGEYAARAKSWRQVYYAHLGINEGKLPAATATAAFDMKYPGGQERLTHPRADRKTR